MISFEHTEVIGWEHAIRGMRNPLNSWNKSDSYEGYDCTACGLIEAKGSCAKEDRGAHCEKYKGFNIGENDMNLMKRLRNAGTDHRKYLRMIAVYVDITAPLYWWKEFDTYRTGVAPNPMDIEMNSCSTMHKIAAKEFTFDDFSCEHLTSRAKDRFEDLIDELNHYRNLYLNGGNDYWTDSDDEDYNAKDKNMWWQMIQLLPTSYNQKRTVMMNYEVLNNIYKSRKGHKLDEWSVGFMEWIKSLPYANELIIGGD